MTQVQLLTLLCFTGAAAVVDARTQRIPNRLIGAGLVSALAVRVGVALGSVDSLASIGAAGYRALAEALLDALASATIGFFGCALLPLALYRAGALGGGDVKLLAVAGALVALGPGLELTRAALFVAVLIGFARLALAGQLGRSLRAMGSLLWRVAGVSRAAAPAPGALTRVAFGPYVFIAACYLALSSWAPAAAAHGPRGEPSHGLDASPITAPAASAARAGG